MYIDKNESSNIKEVKLSNQKLYKLNSAISLGLVFATLLSGCAKNNDEKSIFDFSNDTITTQDTNEKKLENKDQKYIDDYLDFCKKGYLRMPYGEDKVIYYRISELFIINDKISNDVYLQYKDDKKDLLTNKKIPRSIYTDFNLFFKSSVMLNIYDTYKDNIEYQNENIRSIDITEQELKNRLDNWDNTIYNMYADKSSNKIL